jgi:hypothetical protein
MAAVAALRTERALFIQTLHISSDAVARISDIISLPRMWDVHSRACECVPGLRH